MTRHTWKSWPWELEAKGVCELCTACRRLDQSGFVARPDWTQLKEGLRPPQPVSSELGEWQHGWQYHASSPLEHHFRQTVILAHSDAADRAHLRSHAGPGERGAAGSTDGHGVQSGTSPLPHAGARVSPSRPDDDRSIVRVWSQVGHLRQDIEESVCQVREAACEGGWPRTISGKSVPRSRRNSQDEYVASRHELVRAYHTQERLVGMRRGPPKCISHRWCCPRCCPRCCSTRERTEVSRTSGQREVPARGGRHGDWRQMERGGH